MTVGQCAHGTVWRILLLHQDPNKTTVLGSDSEQKDQDPDTMLPYYGLNLLSIGTIHLENLFQDKIIILIKSTIRTLPIL